MGILRKLFDIEHGGGHHRRNGHGDGRDRSHHRPEHHDDGEWWGRHPGSISPLPPDQQCPICRKSNPPGTRRCKQCDTSLENGRCAGCGMASMAGARYCTNCGNSLN